MNKFLRSQSLISSALTVLASLLFGVNSYAQCVAPNANGVTINCGQTATLTASTPGGLVQWYDAAVNGNLLQTGNSFTTPALTTNTSYWVQNQYVSVGGNQSVTFNYNGGMQQWTVPAGVTSITVDARGASGGDHSYGNGGYGGKTVATIPVVPGQIMYVFVGGSPGWGGMNGGYNGGGQGYNYGSSSRNAMAGGGASDVRLGGTALSDRKVVAGGGGGAGSYRYGYCYNNHGGAGGNTTGQNGNYCGYYTPSYCGQGGTQANGGTGAGGYPAGTLGNGGGNGFYGGGGGGGYYGGGAGYYGGGGGGGSNYAIPQATNVVHSQGVQYGNGQVIITYQTVNVNCTSARTQVNVTVTLPAAPTANAAVVNCGATAALTASGGTGTYAWFSNAAGTTQVGTGANFTTPQLTANTTYYVASTSAGGGGAAGTVYTFTNCSATGQFGPTQAQVNSAYTGTNLAGNVTSQSGVQLWTVPSSGTYRIEAFGAQGGGNNQFGRGAQIRGDFSLTAGQQLKIIVGQQGGFSSSGSGGGGSFVATSANVPLLVAGGGGGQYDGSSALYNAHAVTVNGGQPTGCTTGGAGGNGGNGCTSSGAAGGGGFTGNGGNGTYGTGGASFTNGGNGGNHGSNAICVGGFGGGGGTHGNTGGGGGGGGYSGGAGGYHSGSTGSGGGGGSYNNGTNQVNVGGVRIGHGLVTITSMSSSCVSAVVPVAITVNPPTTPTANNVTINCGNTATLTASNGTGTYVWYSDPAGTQQVATGASFTTPVLVSGTTYYVGTSAGQAGCNANTLSNILSGVNTNGAAIAAAVPNGYNFSMDGPNGANSTYISDGGNDMYDGGNYINTNLGNNITYSDGVIANSAAFGAGGQYFTKKLTNMWVLAADVNNISSFSITGNNGANGGGSYNGTTLTVTVGCQTYKVMLKRVYNAGDPSINQMVIIPNNAGATHTWATNTDNTQHDITGLAGTTRLYYLLYAASNGGYIDDNTATNIATTFLTQISATTAAQALCQSNLAPVQITVNSNIAQPVVSGTTTINCGATTTLTSSSGNNTAWYSAAANGNLLGTGSTYTTTSLAAGTTIYAMQATINAGSQTFNYTGSQQTWTVPAGVTSVTVDVQGAQGGQTSYGTAGLGGRTQATIPVTPGATVFINVGGQGNYSTGGWNGGGTPYGCGCVGGGGGASDIRIGGNALANRAIVAGGGGGGGYYWNWTNDHGGHGGGLTGEAGKTNNGYNPTYCGQGGTQAAGGAGAAQGGPAGSLGNGGGAGYYAGSGGGGYYGGGSGYGGGGGGGGSSFANNQATGVTHTQGYKSGNGLITITWNSIGCASSPVSIPITVNALAAPTANNAVIGCGTTAALTASAGGGNTYTWYTNANGTGQVGTGANYTSPALSANTTYYVTANAGLAAGTAFNFSNASATGRTGPTQAQVNAAYSGTNLAGNVTVNTQGIQEWIVPQTGMYRIQANGAQGGGTGGLGARMQGDFSLTQGQKLFIVVGQQGLGPVNSGACGGGGGSFVAVGSASYTTSTALIVAGGGGGASPQQGLPGLITTNGGQGENCQAGGTNGNGGADASSCGSGTGGGGGFLTNGAMGGSYGNQGGYGFLSGAALGGTSQSGAREGGFGGGGGTHSNNTGGGPGGGYSGGSAPYHGTNYEGGGGGSYNNGTNPVNTQGVQAGNGTVVITPLTSPCASPVTPVTVTVNPLTAPVANNVTVNCGATATLNATNNLGAINWYSNANGSTLLSSGANFTTPVLNANTTYYVGAGTGACATAINPVTVTITALTAPTAAASAATVNCGQTSVLTAQGGNGSTYTWFTNANGTNQVGTGASFTTPALSTSTTYYVAATSAPACSSAIVPMAITVNGPAAPVAANAIVNCGNPTTLNAANGGGQVYTWYTDSLATQQVGTGATYTTPTLSTTTTYYVNSGTAMAPAATYTFTNANASGASGPTQAQLNSAYSGTNLAGQVTSSNGIQLWTVPQTGVYTIDARGAQGGSYPGRVTGGNGARMVGTFNLTAGQQIKIIVGQEGYYGGGGGGSFVATSANVPLIVAGGGGGGGSACGGNPPHAGTATNGGNNYNACGYGTYNGGSNGSGGSGPGSNGGPGGGFSGDGTPTDANAGRSFLNGGSGGNVGWYGGFGGGGGTGDDQGAGGGGYSGGAGDSEDGNGGAGGSYNSGTNQSNTAAFQAGMGQVIITRMSSPCVSVVTPVTVTVNAIAAPTVAGNTTLCANGVATTTLTASGGGGNSYTWYANANGTGQLGTNAAFTTPGLNNTTTYYVQSITPQGGSQTFNYTGTAQTFTAPVSGTYTLEAWGAQGGNDPSNPNAIFGGRGGYAKGDVYLNAGQTIQVYVGQQGSGCLNSSWRSTGGGGATDFRLNGGNWNDNAGLLSRILVAGGGGGRHGNNYEGVAYVGNDGGGTSAPNFTANGVNVVGSTQNGGGSSNNTNVAGSFGFANPTPYSNSCSVGGWNGGARGSDNWANGGGGGGWYGGVSSWPTGSGGSGYAYTAASWTPGGYTPTAAYQLANTQLISGNASMPNPAGGNMTGRAGNGIAKITWSGTGCASSVTPVTVTVNALPAAPSANAAAICTGQTATLNASANANWYTVPNGGVSIGQAQAYTTPSLNNTVTYYMEGVNGPCVSATRTPVTVTVNPGPASNAGSSIVDASTCGKNTVNVGGNALAAGQSGQWSVLSATNNGGNPGVFSLAGTSANDQFTGAYGGTYVLQWQITNQSNGCIGMDTMVVTFNQPVDAVINGLIGQGDLLWCGLTGTDWSTSTNWYQKQAAGHYVRMSGAVQPSIANEVFTVSIANGGMCIGSNNPSLSTNSNAEDVYVGPGITWNLSNDSINIAQNLINNGTIIASTGIVNFTGSSNSTVSGSGNTQLFNMRVNKSAGATLTLQQPVLVTNILEMNQGNVFTTTANLLTLGTSSAAPGSLTYNSGTIIGPFKRYFANVASAGTAGLFPVGTAVYNRYADFSFGSGPGVDQYLTVEYKPGAPMQGGIPLYNGLPLMASGSMVQNYSADGYWSVIPTNNNYTAPITSVNYGVTLFANNLTGMQSPQVCRIIKSAGSNNAAQHHVAWQACGTHTPINGAANPQSFLITSTATQGFSWFNIGTPNSQALPVELLSFNGDCNEGQVNLTWQTATEHNSDYFEVEKSRDGMNWQVLTTVNAAGNSTQLLNYEATDAQAMEGNNYYRLTQVDIDGTTKTYDVINVSCSGAAKGYFSAYPNPSTGSFQVILNDKNLVGSGILSVKDTKGAELLNRTIEVKPGINMFSVTDLNLAPGVYYIQIVNGERATDVLKEVIR